MRRLLGAIACALLLATGSGCWFVAAGAAAVVLGVRGGGGGGASGGGTINSNTSAEILTVPVASATTQDVVIQIIDAESDPVAVKLEYRINDAGAPDSDFHLCARLWARIGAATARSSSPAPGTQTGELPTAPNPGIVYVLEWAWAQDLHGIVYTDVTLRLSVVGTISRAGGVAFTADKERVGNRPPSLSSVRVQGAGGLVLVTYEILDPDHDACTVEASFTVGGVGGTAVAALDPGALVGVTTTSTPGTRSFVWDTTAQLPGDTPGVVVRLLAVDVGQLASAPAVSAAVEITNGAPPEIFLSTPSRPTSGAATIAFDLLHADGTPVSASATFVAQGGASGAMTLSGGDDIALPLTASAAGEPHAIVWNYAADLGSNAARHVTVTVTPLAPGGLPGSAAFIVGNSAPQVAFTSLPSGVAGGLVSIGFSLLDSSADPAAVDLEYSTNGLAGPFFPAAITDRRTGLATSAAGQAIAYTFHWQSDADVTGQQTVRLRIRADDGLTGGLSAFATSGPLSIDNSAGGTTGGGSGFTAAFVRPQVGPPSGGTLLTIGGTGFFGTSPAVTIGGHAATQVTVLSDTAMQARTPPGAPGGPLPVQISAGTLTATLAGADGFTYRPSVSFRAISSATPDEQSATYTVDVRLDCGAPPLASDVSVVVIDTLLGSATSGADYAFDAQAVTFPAGSRDGAVQSVSLTVVQDLVPEGDETVLLGLANPGGAIVGEPATHILTITDDEVRIVSFTKNLERTKVVAGLTLFWEVSGPPTTPVTITSSAEPPGPQPLVGSEIITPFPSYPAGLGPRTSYTIRAGTGAGTADLGVARQVGLSTADNGATVDRVRALPDGGMVAAGSFSTLGQSGQATTFTVGDDVASTTFGDQGHGANGDVYIARFDAQGTLVWAQRRQGFQVSDLEVTPQGGVVALVQTAIRSFQVTRYAADGTPLFSTTLDILGQADVSALSAAADGGWFVCGVMSGAATFGTGQAGATTLVPFLSGNSGFASCLFIARYAADGTLEWVRRAGRKSGDPSFPEGDDDPPAFVTALSDGGCLIGGAQAGALAGQSVFPKHFGDPGSEIVAPDDATGYLARYAADGSIAWVRTTTNGSYSNGFKLAVEVADRTIIACGDFSGHLGIDPEGAPRITGRSQSLFVMRFEADGTLDWVTGTAGDAQAFPFTRSLSASTDGSAMLAGGFGGGASSPTSLVIGPGEPLAVTLTTQESGPGLFGSMPFVARFRPEGTLAQVVTAGVNVSMMGVAACEDGGLSLVANPSFIAPTVLGAGGAHPVSLTRSALVVARFDAVDFRMLDEQPQGIGWFQSVFPDDVPSGSTSHARAVATAADGRSYVVGDFHGAETLGASTNRDSIGIPLTTPAGETDGFVMRTDVNGIASRVVVIASDIGSSGIPGNATPTAVSTLPDGGTIVAGTFSGRVLFDGQRGISATTAEDCFLARVPGGAAPVSWTASISGSSGASLRSIAALADGGCLVAIEATGTVTFRSAAGSSVARVASSGLLCAFVARYDGTGAVVWATHVDGVAGGSGVRPVAVIASSDSCEVVAAASGSVVVDPDGAHIPLADPSGTGLDRALFVRLGLAGGAVFATAKVAPAGVALLPLRAAGLPDGGLVLQGSVAGSAVPLDPAHPLVASLLASGDFAARLDVIMRPLWACSFSVRPSGLAVSPGGEVFFTGESSASFQIGVGGPRTLTEQPAADGVPDVFVFKLHADGTPAWGNFIFFDTATAAPVPSVAAFSDASFIVAGAISGRAEGSIFRTDFGFNDSGSGQWDYSGALQHEFATRYFDYVDD